MEAARADEEAAARVNSGHNSPRYQPSPEGSTILARLAQAGALNGKVRKRLIAGTAGTPSCKEHLPLCWFVHLIPSICLFSSFSLLPVDIRPTANVLRQSFFTIASSTNDLHLRPVLQLGAGLLPQYNVQAYKRNVVLAPHGNGWTPPGVLGSMVLHPSVVCSSCD